MPAQEPEAHRAQLVIHCHLVRREDSAIDAKLIEITRKIGVGAELRFADPHIGGIPELSRVELLRAGSAPYSVGVECARLGLIIIDVDDMMEDAVANRQCRSVNLMLDSVQANAVAEAAARLPGGHGVVETVADRSVTADFTIAEIEKPHPGAFILSRPCPHLHRERGEIGDEIGRQSQKAAVGL